MNDFNQLYQAAKNSYFHGVDVYDNFRQIKYAEGKLNIDTKEVLSTGKNKQDVRLVGLDMISDKLSCVKVEYRDEQGEHQEVLGMLYTEGKWLLVCMLASVSEHRFENLYRTDLEQQIADETEIRNVLLRYCHDVYIMDPEDCLPLFWEGARMYHPNADDSFSDVEIQVLRQRWENMPNPEEMGIEEYSRIFYVEMLDANTAIAKVGCAKLDNYFKDYLWLVKQSDTWMIVNKMTQCLHAGERI